MSDRGVGAEVFEFPFTAHRRAGREEFWTAAMDGVAHAERREEESVAA